MPLTSDGWVEPTQTRLCMVCDKEYLVIGVIDIREDERICDKCLKEMED